MGIPFVSNSSNHNHTDMKDQSNLKVIIRTDLGNIRTNNEDTGLFFRVADDQITHEKGSLLIVADGMGGHQAGEVASKMAADIVCKEYFKINGKGNIEKNLAKSFALANKNIFAAASADPSLKGMGTTCTALLVINKQVWYAHAGDSRAYFIKNKTISRITTDHTLIQELLKSGELTIEQAEKHPQRNILTNAMGTKPTLKVDTGKCDLLFETDDKLLLCSDGLYEYLSDEEIAEVVNNATIQHAAEQLVAEAKRRGGHDNITIVLAVNFNEQLAATAVNEKVTKDFIIPVTKEIDLI